MMADIHEILKQYWGYDSFRPLQEEIIRSVLDGHDTLGLLPTGGGKSITFQIPALALSGLTIVVTPLIALMKDQVDHLKERGIKAATVHLGMTHSEILTTYEKVISQNYKFLYLSPERIGTSLFQAKLQYMNVCMLVVDEAHCISQWGYDFRPAYLKIAELRKLLKPNIPVMALTATATPDVVIDIKNKLHFKKGSKTFQSSFERSNLTYSVRYVEDKLGTIVRLLQNIECAIVYVRSRKKCKEISEQLQINHINATYFHAGLSSQEKLQRQENWIQGNTHVIVTTNAFGMGIDKPNVRLVIHLDIPPSPEEYFQEAGRAGRDGKPAEAILLVMKEDKNRLLKHLEEEYPERDFIRMVYEKLASFFQIAIGAGNNSSFEFDIFQFCYAYHLNLTSTYYALKILEQGEYLAYHEDPERLSRVIMTCTKEHLYHVNIDSEGQKILNALLRLYTGLFADFTYISEKRIMEFTHLDRETVYQKLLMLTRMRILHYIPARQKPAILFLTPRLETDEIRIRKEIFEDRKKRQATRIRSIINYVNNLDTCRMKQLLNYFGEDIRHNCGKCDVCKNSHAIISNTSSFKTSDKEATEIHKHILSLLQRAEIPLLPIEISHLLKQYEPQQIAQILQLMLDLEEIYIDKQKHIRLIGDHSYYKVSELCPKPKSQ